MQKNTIDLELWKELYRLASQMKELAPWDWMRETDLFGVQNPETGETGFISVMGMSGEYRAIVVYLGVKALAGFWRVEQAGPWASPEMLLEIPQLQISFTGRDDQEKVDLDVIKHLQLKFRGKHAWPLFRSHRPGFLPWFLEADEAHFLRHVLEQTLHVAGRCKTQPEVLDAPDQESYLVRVPRQDGLTLEWDDQLVRVESPEPLKIPIEIGHGTLAAFKQLPHGEHHVESDFFLFPTPVQEGDRPFFPYLLMMVESKSGTILCSDMLAPQPSLEAMWGQVPQKILARLVEMGSAPKAINVQSELLFQLLKPLAEEVGVPVKQKRTLKHLDAAKESLFQEFLPEDLF